MRWLALAMVAVALGCDDTPSAPEVAWKPMSGADAPRPRGAFSTVWTGKELIVWGGALLVGVTPTGARYDPGSDRWRPLETVGAPAARAAHTAVWTGSEMIVWGGQWIESNGLASGGRYDPVADRWTPTAREAAPIPRAGHVVGWTGSEMMIWGGWTVENGAGWSTRVPLGDGGRYDPVADRWLAMGEHGAPDARENAAAVWTGTELLVWGGESLLADRLRGGGRYDPAADAWSPLSITGAPPVEVEWPSAVWTGTEMIVSGGQHRGREERDLAGRYDPVTDVWRPLASLGRPPALGGEAVWTGTEIVSLGGAYDPARDVWTPLPALGFAADSYGLAWTGSEVLFWGTKFGLGQYDEGSTHGARIPR